MKNNLKFILALTAFIMLIAFQVFPIASTETLTSSSFGRAIVSVLDKTDHTPIDNATICILETREYYQTGKLGSTTAFSLPAKTTSSFNETSPSKTWVEYTLLVYKNGFYPHIYYSLKIEPNTTKTGVVIELTKRAPEDDFTYTESYDFPSTTWTENIIDKYKK